MLCVSNFRLEENDDIGRYFVSEEDYDPGDMIWEEEPLISAPCELPSYCWPRTFPITCFGCLKNVTDSSMKCTICSCPCCSSNCAKNDIHLMYECSVIAEMNTEARKEGYTKILYLRIFLSRTKEPAKFEKFKQLWSTIETEDVSFLNSFNEEAHDIWSFLNAHCGISVTLQEVRRVLATNEINVFKVQNADLFGNEWIGDAVYLKSSIFANGCAPNMEISFVQSVSEKGLTSWNIRFHANRTIKKGEKLTICYCPSEQKLGTVARRQKVSSMRQFWCLCSRCLDPTEEGTYFQAVTCPACGEGKLLPVKPTQLGSVWQCDECDDEKNASSVACIVRSVQGDSFYLVYREQYSLTSMAVADKFVSTRGDGFLSETHYLVYQCAMHWLFGVKIREQEGDPAKADTKLFNQVMKRIRVYLPVTLKLIPSPEIARLQYIVVEALTYYLLHCKDMKKIEKKHLTSHYKMRIITRVVENLSSCLIWKRMKPNPMFEKDLRELSDLHGVWSRRLNDLTKELKIREEGALDALQNLF